MSETKLNRAASAHHRKLVNEYRKKLTKALAALDLAETYLEDEAPNTALCVIKRELAAGRTEPEGKP